MSSLRILRNDTTFSNVQPGTTATSILTKDGIYEGVDILYEPGGNRASRAVTEADLGEISLKIDGVEQRAITPARINKIDEFNGIAIEPGKVPIRFYEEQFDTVGERMSLAWGTSQIGQLTLDVPIADTAVDPRLRLKRRIRPSLEAGPGPVVTYAKQQVETVAAGQKTVVYEGERYFSGDRELLRRVQGIHMFTDQVTAIKLSRGTEVLLEASKAELDEQYRLKGFVPQPDMFHLVPHAMSRLLSDGYVLQQNGRRFSLKMELTISSATNFDMLIMNLGPIR